MKLKITEYNGEMVLTVAGQKQTLIVREEDGGFTFEMLATKGRQLAVPVFVPEAQEETNPAMPVVPAVALETEAVEDAPPQDNDLFETLAALRKELAATDGVPPYLIFHNKTLYEMIEKMPVDMDALGAVSGVGHAKLEKYGHAFLDAIKRFAA